MFIEQSKIVLIAGGPSAAELTIKDVQLMRESAYVLGVNESGVLLPVHGVLTMDRLWWEGRWQACRQRVVQCFVRKSVFDKYLKIPEMNWVDTHSIHMNNTSTELSDDPAHINGNNSGFCAFNFAYAHKPTHIFLFGLDLGGDNKARWHGNYEWDANRENGNHYRKWAGAFDAAATTCREKGVRVFNCSLTSRIKQFRRLSTKDGVRAVVEALD